jgi:hypothetical protein
MDLSANGQALPGRFHMEIAPLLPGRFAAANRFPKHRVFKRSGAGSRKENASKQRE